MFRPRTYCPQPNQYLNSEGPFKSGMEYEYMCRHQIDLFRAPTKVTARGIDLLDNVKWFEQRLLCMQDLTNRKTVPPDSAPLFMWHEHQVVGWFLQCSFVGQLLRSFVCLLRMFPMQYDSEIELQYIVKNSFHDAQGIRPKSVPFAKACQQPRHFARSHSRYSSVISDWVIQKQAPYCKWLRPALEKILPLCLSRFEAQFNNSALTKSVVERVRAWRYINTMRYVMWKPQEFGPYEVLPLPITPLEPPLTENALLVRLTNPPYDDVRRCGPANRKVRKEIIRIRVRKVRNGTRVRKETIKIRQKGARVLKEPNRMCRWSVSHPQHNLIYIQHPSLQVVHLHPQADVLRKSTDQLR